MTQHIQRILLATDFSSCSESALHYSLLLATTCQAELDCVHVTELHPHLDMEGAIIHSYLEEQRRHAKPLLDAIITQARASHPRTTGHESIGVPYEEICKLARERGCDLIVLGTHGWSGLNRILLGSVAERVVSHAPCPVITVRSTDTGIKKEGTSQAEKPARPSPPKHLLVPLDFSDCSLDAVEFAAQFAQDFNSTITLLYVREPHGYGLDFTLDLHGDQRLHDEQVKKQLEKLSQTYRDIGISASTLLKIYPISPAILQAADEVPADLIVMGTHGRSGVSKLLMGSEAAKVLRQSPIPVLTVKTGKYAPEHPKRQHPPSQASSPA